jgi:hypothetical protein
MLKNEVLTQIHMSELVLLRGLYEAADVTLPFYYKILNHEIQPLAPVDAPMTGEISTSDQLRFSERLSAVGSDLSRIVNVRMTVKFRCL